MLPDGWKEQKVEKLCSLTNGNGFKPRDWDTKGLPIIRIQNLNGSENFNYYSKTPDPEWIVNHGDLLFAWAGTKGVSFGPCIWRGEQGVLNQHIYKVNPQAGVCKEWLFLILDRITKNIESQAHGFKSTLVHVHKKDIIGQTAQVPPLAEQRKIAEILSTWDEAISVVDRQLENCRQQKKALMQKLLMGIDKEWRTYKLKELGSTYTGLSGKNKSDFGRGKYFIPYINVFKNHVVDTNCFELVNIGIHEKQNKVVYGDIIFTLSSETHEEVGMSSVFLSKIDNVYLNSFCFGFRLNNFCTITPNYAKYYFRSDDFRSKIISLAQGATRYNLSKKRFEELSICVPSVEKQIYIANILDNLMDSIRILEKKLALLQDEKKSLMQQLLTGKKRVAV